MIINDNNISGENPKTHVLVMSGLLKKGFSVILVLILLLAIINIVQLQKTKNQLNKLVSTNIKKMALGSIMRDSIRLRTISLYKMLETHDDYFQRDEEIYQFYNYAKQYREARDKIIALGITKIEKKLNEEILTQIKIAQPLTRDAAENMLSNITHEQLQEKVNLAISSQEKLYQLLNQLNMLQENQTNQALNDVNQNFIYTIIFTLIVTIIVIFFSIKIARKIYHHVIDTSNILAQKNTDLEKAYVKADESTKIKSEFITKMSHELRTPMNGVMGMIQLLQTTKQDEEQKDYTETALNSCESLMSIIDNILDFSKIESGSIDVDKTPFNIKTMIHDVFHSFEKMAQEKNIKYT